MARAGKILNYDEFLEKYPDWILWDTVTYYQESTPEATEAARLRRIKETGYVVKFIQDHGLTRRTLCETAPDIPETFCVYLKDVTPEGLEFYRAGYKKWLNRFERNMHADPSDVSVMEKALFDMRTKAEPVTDSKQSDISEKNVRKSSPKKTVLFKKYDDMSWHTEGDFPSDLSPDASCTHIGMFLAWALLNNMASDEHLRDFQSSIEKLRRREITPGEYLRNNCDGKLTIEELNAASNQFANHYYDMSNGAYIRDYENLLSTNLPSTYHVADSWEAYDKLEIVLSQRFAEWDKRNK